MNRYQSIVSAIISVICIFGVPYLNRKGILIDESAVSTVVCGIIAFGAFCWTAWKNHNITEAAMEAQCLLEEMKTDFGIEENADEEDEEVEENDL